VIIFARVQTAKFDPFSGLQRRRAPAFSEFDVAAFEPGLSPTQRRLLFKAAWPQLELPLIGPERPPAERAE
jgi:hypothetical protein